MSDEPLLLLDTCAIIFIANGTPIEPAAEQLISEAGFDGRLHVSPMSAWEIGIGVAKGRLILPLSPIDFFNRFLERMEARLSVISPEILIESSSLPGDPHKDPMDRILMASARALDMILVTSDRPILKYGRKGHLRTLAC
ncbi:MULTISPECIES: type II toxin-antitoxin system VapC family toxin [unclassified Mesorhizobium]|uniref:type II toxin-antitoxin system VapC family toxin n=1 Tax=unclassified Mesorhizobium TaxID=325217 RepID=UPI0030147CAB